MVRSFSPRVWRARLSAYSITPLQAISATATTHRDRSGPVMKSLASRPTTPMGIEPTMMYHPIRWSSLPRSSGFAMPTAHALAIRQMSFQK